MHRSGSNDEGVIRERGRHDELLAQGGLYTQLHDSQFAAAAQRFAT